MVGHSRTCARCRRACTRGLQTFTSLLRRPDGGQLALHWSSCTIVAAYTPRYLAAVVTFAWAPTRAARGRRAQCRCPGLPTERCTCVPVGACRMPTAVGEAVHEVPEVAPPTVATPSPGHQRTNTTCCAATQGQRHTPVLGSTARANNLPLRWQPQRMLAITGIGVKDQSSAQTTVQGQMDEVWQAGPLRRPLFSGVYAFSPSRNKLFPFARFLF